MLERCIQILLSPLRVGRISPQRLEVAEHTREGRGYLVGPVREDPPTAFALGTQLCDVVLEAICHPVEVLRERSNLVVARYGEAHVELPIGHPSHDALRRLDTRMQDARQQERGDQS